MNRLPAWILNEGPAYGYLRDAVKELKLVTPPEDRPEMLESEPSVDDLGDEE